MATIRTKTKQTKVNKMTYSSKLKIKKEHFDHIAEKIAKTIENYPELVVAYENGNFRNSDLI